MKKSRYTEHQIVNILKQAGAVRGTTGWGNHERLVRADRKTPPLGLLDVLRQTAADGPPVDTRIQRGEAPRQPGTNTARRVPTAGRKRRKLQFRNVSLTGKLTEILERQESLQGIHQGGVAGLLFFAAQMAGADYGADVGQGAFEFFVDYQKIRFV